MNKRAVVFVDGDNVSATHAAKIMTVAKTHGPVHLARVYLDASKHPGWQSAAGYRLCHAGTGKNASDILMTIDAMERSFDSAQDTVLIVSSDGDFSHLAMRLRERGHAVVGLGETKAPECFRAACSEFVCLSQAQTVVQPCKQNKTLSKMDKNICAVIKKHGQRDSGIQIVTLNIEMRKQHDVAIGTYPERTWRAYLTKRPSLYDIDPRGSEARVRLRSQTAQTVNLRDTRD